ncbi:hypothetical protein [Limnoglobus roseus]|uniref:Uncharacterized protein n=1 Tax=Limnoglobus roseus TaxID=2598579 RepID=A0A5C1A9T3_9BACT|nr:hypothetical protein [Limnoglobus roseus]QEL13884.1 hypothetical protein PX52LOC_00742 [Limnoglobus roseus]
MATQLIEPDDIKVGAVGSLAVPVEDVGGEFNDGEDLDTAEGIPTVRRPGRHEWFTLFLDRELRCRLLAVKKAGRTFENDYYHVATELRRTIPGEVKPFVVVPYYSWDLKRVDLFVTPAYEPGVSGWGDSMLVLLRKGTEWHAKHQVKIMSNKDAAKYDIRFDDIPGTPVFPAELTGVLLGTAIGPDRFITTAENPVLRTLQKGAVLV